MKAIKESTADSMGRANRTEAVQIRFDPKRRFTLEMVARRHGRPLSNLLDEVVNDWLHSPVNSDILRGAEGAWSPFPSDRFVRQAQTFPDTLTDLEQVLWILIKEDDQLWTGPAKKERPAASSSTFDFKLLRERWQVFCERTLDSKELYDLNEHISTRLKRRKR